MNFNSLIWTQLLNQIRLSNIKPDLSHIPESVLVPIPFILEPKSTISLIHISLLDHGIEQNDCEMIFQDWSYNQDDFHVRILHDPNQIGDNNNINRKEAIKSGFLETQHYFNWAATLGSIRHPLEPPP